MTRPALLVVSALMAFASLPSAQELSPFRSSTRLVLLQATVVDRHDAPVTDLDREAFTIHENGTPQRIEVFRREDVPVSIATTPVSPTMKPALPMRPRLSTKSLTIFLNIASSGRSMFNPPTRVQLV